MGEIAKMPRLDLDDLLDALRPVETGPGRFVARNLRSGHPTTLGSQLLGLSVAVAEHVFPGMTVQTLHTVFPRPGRADRPIDVEVETVQSGRSLATAQVTYRQQGREHCRTLVMLTRAEPDFLRHARVLPDEVPDPDAWETFDCPLAPWETRIEGGAAAWDASTARTGSADIWMRCKESAGDQSLSRALLAHAVEAFVVTVGQLPYPAAEIVRRGGRGHEAVLSQTVTFHEPFALDDWLLLRVESVYAGRSRTHARMQAYAKGRLVASVSGDGLVRSAAAVPPRA